MIAPQVFPTNFDTVEGLMLTGRRSDSLPLSVHTTTDCTLLVEAQVLPPTTTDIKAEPAPRLHKKITVRLHKKYTVKEL